MFTCLLLTIGIGYLFAVAFLYLVEIEPHSKDDHGVVGAVIEKYYGRRGETRLGAALKGSMGDTVTAAEKEQIFQWIEGGAQEAEYPKVEGIFQNSCAICHSAEGGMPTALMTTYEEVVAYTAVDMGQSVKTLVGVSHVHLFGMSFIFFLTGLIFAMSEIDARWRTILIATPFIAIWVDIGSWWFTKMKPVFAYTVIIGGILMGVALLLQILISLWEMWLKRTDTR
ncbi:MAG: hypothetical protein ACE5F7_09340 [Nitrospiria bacterium]